MSNLEQVAEQLYPKPTRVGPDFVYYGPKGTVGSPDHARLIEIQKNGDELILIYTDDSHQGLLVLRSKEFGLPRMDMRGPDGVKTGTLEEVVLAKGSASIIDHTRFALQGRTVPIQNHGSPPAPLPVDYGATMFAPQEFLPHMLSELLLANSFTIDGENAFGEDSYLHSVTASMPMSKAATLGLVEPTPENLKKRWLTYVVVNSSYGQDGSSAFSAQDMESVFKPYRARNQDRKSPDLYRFITAKDSKEVADIISRLSNGQAIVNMFTLTEARTMRERLGSLDFDASIYGHDSRPMAYGKGIGIVDTRGLEKTLFPRIAPLSLAGLGLLSDVSLEGFAKRKSKHFDYVLNSELIRGGSIEGLENLVRQNVDDVEATRNHYQRLASWFFNTAHLTGTEYNDLSNRGIWSAKRNFWDYIRHVQGENSKMRNPAAVQKNRLDIGDFTEFYVPNRISPDVRMVERTGIGRTAYVYQSAWPYRAFLEDMLLRLEERGDRHAETNLPQRRNLEGLMSQANSSNPYLRFLSHRTLHEVVLQPLHLIKSVLLDKENYLTYENGSISSSITGKVLEDTDQVFVRYYQAKDSGASLAFIESQFVDDYIDEVPVMEENPFNDTIPEDLPVPFDAATKRPAKARSKREVKGEWVSFSDFRKMFFSTYGLVLDDVLSKYDKEIGGLIGFELNQERTEEGIIRQRMPIVSSKGPFRVVDTSEGGLGKIEADPSLEVFVEGISTIRANKSRRIVLTEADYMGKKIVFSTGTMLPYTRNEYLNGLSLGVASGSARLYEKRFGKDPHSSQAGFIGEGTGIAEPVRIDGKRMVEALSASIGRVYGNDVSMRDLTFQTRKHDYPHVYLAGDQSGGPASLQDMMRDLLSREPGVYALSGSGADGQREFGRQEAMAPGVSYAKIDAGRRGEYYVAIDPDAASLKFRESPLAYLLNGILGSAMDTSALAGRYGITQNTAYFSNIAKDAAPSLA